MNGAQTAPVSIDVDYCAWIDDLEAIAAEPAGEDFEELCWGLLQRRYPIKDLVRLPSAMGGDRGIEGFSADGIAYQCYADQDSLNLRQRTDKQKRKLTTDTSKLKKHCKELAPMFVNNKVVLDHYFLMVPQFHAAELQFHAAHRAAAVRGFDLPFISEDFAVRIVTPSDYPDEFQALLAGGFTSLALTAPEIDASAPALFLSTQPELIAAMDAKIEVIVPDAVSRAKLRDIMIRRFLEGEQVRLELQDWPQTSSEVEERQLVREAELELENLLSDASAARRVDDLIKGFQDDLIVNVKGLRSIDAARIAHGQISEWLMRCPLDFREPA